MKCVGTFILLGAAGISLAADTKDAKDVKVLEQVVAKVNNQIVTKGELDKSREQAAAEIQRQKIPADRAKELMQQTEANLLREKIDQLLLVQKAKDLDINVDGDVSKRLAQIQVESKITDQDKFQAYVREGTGLSFEDFKQRLKDDMMTSEVIRREVGSRINVPKADQMKYYEEHKSEFVREEQVVLREILISTENKDEKGKAAAEKKAKDLVTRARKGENFGTLAHDNSDADTARSYGELPPYKRGMLDKSFEDIVFKQEKGYVTDPFKRPNGFLILKVEEHYQQGLQSFDAVQNEVMEKLYSPKMEPAVRDYLTKLRKEAFLELRAGYVDSGAAPGKDTSWRDPAQLKPQTVTKEEVAMRVRRKRMLWMMPVPGTKPVVGQSSSGSSSMSKSASKSAAPGGPKTVPVAAPPTGAAAAPGTPGATSNQQIPGSSPIPATGQK